MSYKIGLGFDVHRLIKAKKALVLGGVKINSPFSLKAVSDGDVVLHALSDALCGAAGLGDIGDYFPPARKFAGLNSREIVKLILNKIKKNFKIKNIDIVIVAEKPRLLPHKKNIRSSLESIFGISAINIKVKSKEKLDILGAKDAMSCFAIALLRKR